MKKWKELCSKGAKQQRLRKSMLYQEVHSTLEPYLKEYEKTKSATILDKARKYLIDNINEYTPASQERIFFFLD